MKFYNLKFNANAPAAQQINVPTNTDYKLGVKVVKNGEELALSADGATYGGLRADDAKTNGYLTFTLSSDDNATVKESILSVDGAGEFKVVENVYKSQCGDIAAANGGGGSGGDTTLSAATTFTSWTVTPSRWTTGSGTNYTFNAPQYGDFYFETEPRHGWYWENPDSIVVDLGSDDPTETSLSVAWED